MYVCILVYGERERERERERGYDVLDKSKIRASQTFPLFLLNIF